MAHKTKNCSKCNNAFPLSEFSKDLKNKDNLNNVCKECTNHYSRNYCKNMTPNLIENHKFMRMFRNIKLKHEIIYHYGSRCACCGEKQIEFLTIDHINNDGHKQPIKERRHLYNWLKQNNFPNGFQVLCFNCNLSKYYMAKELPSIAKCIHQRTDKDNCLLKNAYTNKPQSSQTRRSRQQKEKQIVTNHYGGKCACCGITELELLTIDHINNDGNEHRKNIKNNIYKWLIDNNFPKEFQVLCHNCNHSKHFGKGTCIHKRKVDFDIYVKAISLKNKTIWRINPYTNEKIDCCIGYKNAAKLNKVNDNYIPCGRGKKSKKDTGSSYNKLLFWRYIERGWLEVASCHFRRNQSAFYSNNRNI